VELREGEDLGGRRFRVVGLRWLLHVGLGVGGIFSFPFVLCSSSWRFWGLVDCVRKWVPRVAVMRVWS
jgi:hypothetical protein